MHDSRQHVKSDTAAVDDTAERNGQAEGVDALEQARRQRLQDGEDCRQAALDYRRRRGWSVLALCPPDHIGVGKKHAKDCTHPGKVPLWSWKEFQDRLPTEDEINQVWRHHPTANVGMATGPVSGLVRIDVEGPAAAAALQEKSRGDLPPTLQFKSGRADDTGRGWLYAIPPGVKVKTTAEEHGEKQELRFQAKGAQTVLPPSRHKDGGRYTWLPGHGPDEIEAAPMPAWLIQELRPDAPRRKKARAGKRRKQAQGGAGFFDDDDKIHKGHRHTTLISRAGELRRLGLGFEAILAALLAENETRCVPPLPTAEVEGIARWIADKPAGDTPREPEEPPAWEEPIPLTADVACPPFPTELLPEVLARWVRAEAKATQTPAGLAGCLVLAIAGAALAGKFRVIVRDGWAEPLNLFTVVSLPPGDRKSAVFADALAPVQEAERRAQEDMAGTIAAAASDHQVLKDRLKALQTAAAKAKDPEEAARLGEEARQVARDLANHKVPHPPQFYCDDVTPQKLGKLLDQQGGRMLQASPEGTAFEIVKGRYSETPDFDVYLKGHAGDPLRVDRVSREQDSVDQPALSVALAVQPDVILGLADQPSLRGRGFLARFLYAIPASRLGLRAVAPAPVPKTVANAYRHLMARLWELPGSSDAAGRPSPNLLFLSREADQAVQAFETWVEPQLAEGEELSYLAGWAAKLAGAVVRIAGTFHVVSALTEGRPWQGTIDQETVRRAIRLGREYLLPHALAAFSAMGADPRTEPARWVLRWLRSQYSQYSQSAPLTLSRSQIHQGNRRKFEPVETLDPVLDLLVKHRYLRRKPDSGRPGRGYRSPAYEVNPAVFTTDSEADPRTDCTDCTDSDATNEHGDAWEGVAE
jgi:hypothetical protein